MTCILAYHDGADAWMACDSRVTDDNLQINTIPGGKIRTAGGAMFASYGDARLLNLLQAHLSEIRDEVECGNPCHVAVYRAIKDHAMEWGIMNDDGLIEGTGALVSDLSGVWMIPSGLSILQSGSNFAAGGVYPVAEGAWYGLSGNETAERMLATLRICADLNASVGPPYYVYCNGNLIMRPEA